MMRPVAGRERLVALALLVPILAIACARTPSPQTEAPPHSPADSIVLERTPCFGMCPIYRLRIDRNANVVFTPRVRGSTGASQRAVAESWVPDSLRAQLWRLGFWTLPDQIAGSALCPAYATDHPTIVISTFGESSKRVTYYTGCYLRGDQAMAPQLTALRRFADRMDTLTGAYRWIQPSDGR